MCRDRVQQYAELSLAHNAPTSRGVRHGKMATWRYPIVKGRDAAMPSKYGDTSIRDTLCAI